MSSIIQVCDKDTVMESDKQQGTAAIIFFEEDDLRQAFLIGHECIEIDVQDPNVAYMVIGLLSRYFTFNRAFPKGCANALHFLSHNIFKTPEVKNPAFLKFARDLKNFKEKHIIIIIIIIVFIGALG